MFSKIFFLSILIAFSVNAQEVSFLQKGDDAYKSFNNKQALEFYQKAFDNEPGNYEIAWKLARAYVDVGETLEGEAREDYYKKSEKYARKAVELKNDGSNGHLYLAIALGRVALDASAKQRIKMSKEIRKEAELAIKLNPENDLAYHVLGRWHRKISNLSWIEKGFADMFLGGVPKDASNEAAVENFKKAIEINPDYINHHLELGITYEMMDKDDLARQQFEACLALPISSAKDKEHKKKAQELLNDL